ncbi:Aste57867_18411 [Aphanomyces stellatus]|uniref:Aste57867_18411 protein n=1 Tax=Aphanomyces stellatus TaxID=120398 RepID=A0A485LA14_9STRA|nr:hypothetical protein As57867_018349 [Aphanomyces stellatus]VFT95147.1 Aste57867_18411 [Aphanomyces stellatus]
MKSIAALSCLVAMASATRIFESLSDTDRSQLEQQLTKWKTLYGPIAHAKGFTPEAVLKVDSHSDMELLRFHETTQSVLRAAALNPLANFSAFNQFALLNDAEFKQVMVSSFGTSSFEVTEAAEGVVGDDAVGGGPDSIDWSTHRCNPSVKSQGQCGSCWAFSTVGTAETAHCLATGNLLDLSEQQVVSCSTNGGSQGCKGGFPPGAVDFIRQQGLCTQQDWAYTSGTTTQTGNCDRNCQKTTLAIGNTVQANGEAALQTALANQPVTVIVEAGNDVWRNYKGGVVTQCPGGKSDHAVIAVGYGAATGQFFKIKNSWGPQWGDNGYIYLQRGVGGIGMCNVAQAVTYPQLQGH